MARALEDGSGVGGMMEEYLTIAEVAARLKIKPKTIKNKMAAGIFRRGVHFFSPADWGRGLNGLPSLSG